MTLRIIQGVFVVACAAMGAFWADYILQIQHTDTTVPFTEQARTMWLTSGALIGAGIASLLLFSLRFVTQKLFERLFPVVIAIALSLMLGYFLARIVMMVFPPPNPEDLTFHVFLTSSLMLIFGYVGISLGLTKASHGFHSRSSITSPKYQVSSRL